MQEWHYKHAVRIGAEDAAKHGLQEGALVLESTLAGTPSSSQELPTGDQQSPTGDAAVSSQMQISRLVLNSCPEAAPIACLITWSPQQAIAVAEMLKLMCHSTRCTGAGIHTHSI